MAAESGLITLEETDTECCYALQDKVWVRGPGDEPWEVYTVMADADTLPKASAQECRCGGSAATEVGEASAASGAGSPCSTSASGR